MFREDLAKHGTRPATGEGEGLEAEMMAGIARRRATGLEGLEGSDSMIDRSKADPERMDSSRTRFSEVDG